MEFHPEEKDCRLVAEADSKGSGVDYLVTFDQTLIKRLASRSTVRIVAPSTCWTELAIPAGTRPAREPGPGHPLYGCQVVAGVNLLGD
jgi:hypothetical protein